jgi:hypothetical protein
MAESWIDLERDLAAAVFFGEGVTPELCGRAYAEIKRLRKGLILSDREPDSPTFVYLVDRRYNPRTRFFPRGLLDVMKRG